MPPRTGRPKTENPKAVEVKARVDQETDRRIQEYCKQHGITRTELVRKGIELVLGQEK